MPSTSEPKQRPPLRERKLLIISASFAALEGFDLACYGTTVPSLLADKSMGATPSSAGTVGSLVAVGMLIGAALAAVLVNRFGSRKLLLWGASVFSLGMVGCALSPTITLFGAARLLVGLGLGAVLPTLLAYVAEMTAPGRRSRNVGITMAGYAAGALAAPLLAAALLPAQSYRWIYVIGVIPALILIPIAWRVMPDTPSKTHATASAEAGGAPVDTHGGAAKVDGLRQLFAPGVRAATLLFWVMSFCGLLLVFGISTWLPTIMQTAGYSLGSSLLQTAAMWVGAGVGMIVGGRVADTLGPKPVVTAAFLIGCVSLVIMSFNPSIVLLFLLMFVSGVGFIGAQVLTNAYIVTAYPDSLRGPAIGWALSVGRLGAIVGPSLGGWVLSSGLNVQWNFYSFAIWGAIGAVATLLVPKVIRPVAARQTANSGHL
jgi:AAHS family benzoate transporter-like MFS transporter